MSQRGVRVVVGEGQSKRRGLLRFVLEGEGYEVVGQAATSAELARILSIEKPDAVILDDGIGATAVQVAREASPGSKIVLVWPEGVVPVGGHVRVEPGQVMRQLGPAVAALTIGLATAKEGLKQPEWVARVRKDPATLRERLERAKSRDAAAAAAAAAVPLVILPGEATAAAEPTIVLTDEAAAATARTGAAAGVAVGAAVGVAVGATTLAAAASPGPSAAARNQALGNLALGGAAVVGALALSLAIVGGRVPADVVDVSGPSPTPSSGTSPPLTPTPSSSASGSGPGGTTTPSVTGGGPTGGGTSSGDGPTGGGPTGGGPTGGGTTTSTTYPPSPTHSSSHTPPPTHSPSPTPTYPPSPSAAPAALAVPAVGILTFVAVGRTDDRSPALHHHKR